MSTLLAETPRSTAGTPSLYEADETGWLEQVARCIVEGRFDDIDYPHLEEYMTDTAKRDRREVWSRLVILLAHWLKWEFQPERRSTSWQRTIHDQHRELTKIFESETLRNHAHDELDDAYGHAVTDAALETGLPTSAFPAANPRTLEEWLALGFDP